MAKKEWHRIWNSRSLTGSDDISLAELLRLSGWDTNLTEAMHAVFMDYVKELGAWVGLRDGQSLFEAGCGSGALLYALNSLWRLQMSGLDYSSSLIEAARKALPDVDFVCERIGNMPTDPKCDVIIVNSVFQYLDKQEAEAAVSRMLTRADIVAVMDVPDVETQSGAEALRMEALNPDQYVKLYRGLDHTYYSQDWFREQASLKNFDCEFRNSFIPGLRQNAFRFSCLIKKC